MRRTGTTNRAWAAILAALLVFAQLAFVPGGAPGALAQMRKDPLKIVTSSGEHAFEVEVTETPEQKARGLMFRRSLADNAGMLFPYLPPQEATMWMRNTYISLDMVFIKADGVVHRIEHGTEPFSEAVIASRGDVAAVLELKAGVAARIGIAPGDRILHRMFAPAKQ